MKHPAPQCFIGQLAEPAFHQDEDVELSLRSTAVSMLADQLLGRRRLKRRSPSRETPCARVLLPIPDCVLTLQLGWATGRGEPASSLDTRGLTGF